MPSYEFQLVNVFGETAFGGNPLAILPKADGLNDDTMQAIARQFNLSETVFVMPPTHDALADVRIFSPSYEMSFAGHPVIGVAWYLAQQHSTPFYIRTPAKTVAIHQQKQAMMLSTQGYTCAVSKADKTSLAMMTGLHETAVAQQAYFVNAGVRQLLLEVADKTALDNTKVNLARLRELYANDDVQDEIMLYLWCRAGDVLVSRLMFEQDNGLLEDSGTGSAAVNLGAYLHHTGVRAGTYAIHQGDGMSRPNRLYLQIDGDVISMGGVVQHVGQGAFFVDKIS